MSDAYERWLAAKAEGEVPDGFADRVLARAETLRPHRRMPLWIAAAASVAFLLRVASTLLVFAAT
jgi:hypothetical protein